MTKQLFLLTLLLITSPAQSGVVSENISDVCTIQNDGGLARVLFRWNAPSDGVDSQIAIRKATLVFNAQGSPVDKTLRLRLYPITTPWIEENVDWDFAWSKPGGDFPEDLFARTEVDLRTGGGPVTVDVTGIVKEVLEDGFQADGLILTVDPDLGEGIPAEDLARLEGLSAGSLQISYRSVPPIPTAVIQTE